ncbi:MAG: hypothetical protein VW707_10595, partial [Candidatus Puniceispirillum sp.]
PFTKPAEKLGDWQYAKHEEFEKAGLLALVGTGAEPGISNIFARYAADHLFSEIDEITVLDGGNLVVENDEGEEIFADKVGAILARDLIRLYPNSTFVADVKSTGLFASDPVLRAHGAKADYWKTGHSHMKRRVKEIGALAGFEKSGHYFLAAPIGRGYDCGMRVAVEICKLLDRNP